MKEVKKIMAVKRKKNKIKKDDEDEIQCSSCGRYRNKKYFFNSYNKSESASGVVPYCKDCIKDMCNDKLTNRPIMSEVLKLLRKIDRPYIDRIWKIALGDNPENEFNAIGRYMRMLNMKQYQNFKWGEGDRDVTQVFDNSEPKETIIEKLNNFKINDEIITLFGTGYTKEEYFRMKEKYDYLSQGYNLSTPMHTEALVSYVRVKVKEEMAIALGKTQEAKTWGDMAQRAAEKAKINPNQFSAKDLQGGVNSFSEVAQKIEQTYDIIKILPKFRFRPMDAVDFCIWEYINYARDTEGLPLLDYSDVYKFYDDRKEAYIKQYGDPTGMFINDPTKKNRENIKNFIQDQTEEE